MASLRNAGIGNLVPRGTKLVSASQVQALSMFAFLSSCMTACSCAQYLADAGFKVDNLKVNVPAGERKPVTFTYMAPLQIRPGSIAALGLSEAVVVSVTGTLKGGVPAPKTAAGRRVSLYIHCCTGQSL